MRARRTVLALAVVLGLLVAVVLVADRVVAVTVAVPPDRLAARLPVVLADGTTVDADVEVLARVSDGTLVVEPVRARVAGQDLDLAQVDVLRSFGLDDELRGGVEVTDVDVRDEAGSPVVEVRLACRTGCTLR